MRIEILEIVNVIVQQMKKFGFTLINPIALRNISNFGLSECNRVTSWKRHNGESCDILYLYLDRRGKKIDHYFFNTQ